MNDNTPIIDLRAAFMAVRIYNKLPEALKEGDYNGRLLPFLTRGVLTRTGIDLEFSSDSDIIPLSPEARKVLSKVKVKLNHQKTV